MAVPLFPPHPASGDGGPPAKRARTEDDLEPEQVWLNKVKGVINVRVQTPSSTEWTLDGSTVTIAIDVTETVEEDCESVWMCERIADRRVEKRDTREDRSGGIETETGVRCECN